MRDGDLELRPHRAADDDALAALFEEPDVKRWWPDGWYEAERGWVVLVDEALSGWIEYDEETWEWSPSVAFGALSCPPILPTPVSSILSLPRRCLSGGSKSWRT